MEINIGEHVLSDWCCRNGAHYRETQNWMGTELYVDIFRLNDDQCWSVGCGDNIPLRQMFIMIFSPGNQRL